jgi:hypothetical protein
VNRLGAVALLGASGLLVACGTETASSPTTGGSDETPGATTAPVSVARPTEVPPASGEVTTRFPATVLDEGDGAELCLGGVMESYPPQCGGPRLLGWDWSEHDGHFETAGGVRFGDFVITGGFDGSDVTVTSAVPAAEWDEPAVLPEPDDFATPCPEPPGGWKPVEPATTTEQTRQEAARVAEALPTYGGLWVDQSINPAHDQGPGEDGGGGLDWELSMNDPLLLVLNVRVTDDVAGAEAALREVWGGALCVSEARHTEPELRRIQDEAQHLPGVTSTSGGSDVVEVGVLHDDGSIQAWADQEYGEGTVLIFSGLQPVD